MKPINMFFTLQWLVKIFILLQYSSVFYGLPDTYFYCIYTSTISFFPCTMRKEREKRGTPAFLVIVPFISAFFFVRANKTIQRHGALCKNTGHAACIMQTKRGSLLLVSSVSRLKCPCSETRRRRLEQRWPKHTN